MTEMPQMYVIEKIVNETSVVKTFFLKGEIDYKPGQFVMVWVPGVDEKPYSISYTEKDSFAITVEKKGGYTKEMHKFEVGDKLGIRGPYGNPFTVMQGSTCVIAGGCGIAPIMPLIDELNDPIVIVGCQTAKRLLFKDAVKDYNVCTDDGTTGYQ